MEERKSNEQKQDLDNAIREIDAILDKYNVKDCLVVLATADVWCGAIGGNVQSLAYAIKDGMNTKYEVHGDLNRLVKLLNNK